MEKKCQRPYRLPFLLSVVPKWFYASNDRSHSGDTGHEFAFRDTVVCYIHFRANGSMDACVIDGTGVGAYDAAGGI